MLKIVNPDSSVCYINPLAVVGLSTATVDGTVITYIHLPHSEYNMVQGDRMAAIAAAVECMTGCDAYTVDLSDPALSF